MAAVQSPALHDEAAHVGPKIMRLIAVNIIPHPCLTPESEVAY